LVECVVSRATCAASEPSASTTSWSAFVEGAQRAPVVLVPDGVGEVLDQCPAARDVHHLHAAADAEQGQVAVHRAQGERRFERVALGHEPQVGAAGQDQPVEEVEHDVGARRSRRRRAAGAPRARPRAAPRPSTCGEGARLPCPTPSQRACSTAVQIPITGLHHVHFWSVHRVLR
jgi:hypothetical protein